MTTKPSSAPWADEPFRLIPTASKTQDVCRPQHPPSTSNRLTLHQASIPHIHCASEMSQAHNTLIRGLNAIVQQAPYVPDAAHDGFNAQDVKDLLFFVKSWTKMVNHHHWVEETYLFPEVERFSGRPSLMDDPKHQHELFHDGMEKLLEYSSSTGPEEYRWEGAGGMKQIIDSFSKNLTDHLHAEIDVILGLGDLDGPGLKKTWKEAENIAKQTGNIGMMVSPRD